METDALTRMIAPMKRSAFFERYWGREAFHAVGNTSKFDDVFGWRGFNDLLNTHYTHIDYPRIRMVLDTQGLRSELFTETSKHFVGRKRRQHMSPKKVLELSEEGATVIIGSVHELDGTLQRFARRLSKEFETESININAYFSRPGRQALAPHQDRYDVFVLQVEGQKEWALYGLSDDYPILGGPASEAEKVPTVRRKVLLRKGDSLYLPRGYWHAAVACEDDSLHLTVAVVRCTGVDFLNWLLKAEMEKRALWRRDIPFGCNDDKGGRQEKENVSRWIVALGSDLARIMEEPADVAERFRRHLLEASGDGCVNAAGRFEFPRGGRARS